MSAAVTLEAERLLLRPIDAELDFVPWAEMMSDAETVRYLWTNQILTKDQAWQNMVMNIGHWQARGYGFFSVVLKETGEWVGRIGPYNPHGWPEREIGWAVHPAHTRKGYASEAARACLPYVFGELGWDSVNHVMVEGNVGSIGVAEAIGSKLIRRIEDKDGCRTRLIYGQTASLSPSS